MPPLSLDLSLEENEFEKQNAVHFSSDMRNNHSNILV